MDAVVGIVGRDGLASGEEAVGLGVLDEGAGTSERGEEGRRIGEAAAGGIGGSQVGDGQAGRDAIAMRACEVGLFGVPIGSLGKGHRVQSIMHNGRRISIVHNERSAHSSNDTWGTMGRFR